MNAYFTAPHGTLYQGDALITLSALPAESVQCCVTSPPYWGLRDYGTKGQIGLEETPQKHIERLLAVFREVRRVLKNDGTLWVNYGDTYLCQQGKGFNGLPIKNLLGLPWRLAFALQDDGWILRSDIIWHKPNPMPESVKDRPTRAHEYLFLFSKRAKYFYDWEAIREPVAALCDHNSRPQNTQALQGTGSIPAVGKGNAKTFRGGGSYTGGNSFDNAFEKERDSHGNAPNLTYTRNIRSVWTIPTFPCPDAHFATFPPMLIKPCILAGSRPGDTVLDPFMGSGTTGLVSRQLGRKWLGVELNPEYCALALKRIDVTRLMLTELPGVEGGAM